MTNRDCGAAALAYGDKIKTDPAFETAKLSEALRALARAHGIANADGEEESEATAPATRSVEL